MPFLRKRDTGAVTEFLNADSLEYQLLKAQRFQANVTANLPSGLSGIAAGMVGGSILAGQPVWEDVAEQDAGFPDPPGGRVLVAVLPGAAAAATETVNVSQAMQQLAGTLTDVEYLMNGAITGQATNNRSVTLQQVQVTATPARVVTALAAVTFGAGVNNPGPGGGAQPGPVPTPLTITTAAFSAADPTELEVVSAPVGTGIADPGGLLYAVYTRA